MATQASHFEYEGFAAISDKLTAMKVSTPEFQEKVRKAVWQVLAGVRRAVAENASFANSKHNSIQAIRRSVYKKIMGGSVSILDKRGWKGKATGQSTRTAQINGYSGKDRGFILRFVNSGTGDRYAGSGRNYRLSGDYIQSQRGKAGFRGKIEARNFFAPVANSTIQEAAERLAEIIDKEIALQYNK